MLALSKRLTSSSPLSKFGFIQTTCSPAHLFASAAHFATSYALSPLPALTIRSLEERIHLIARSPSAASPSGVVPDGGVLRETLTVEAFGLGPEATTSP